MAKTNRQGAVLVAAMMLPAAVGAQALIDLGVPGGLPRTQIINDTGDVEGFGLAVSAAGDVNGDGIDDVIIGSPQPGSGPWLGEAYVILGSGSPAASISVSGLSGSNGFRLNTGDLEFSQEVGRVVAGGQDYNGDGVDDVLVGSLLGGAGVVNLMLGRDTPFPAQVNLAALSVSEGQYIFPPVFSDVIQDATFAGDVNNDGLPDLLLGVGNSRSNVGDAYVMFGRPAPYSAQNLGNLNGIDGFVIPGFRLNDLMGESVAPARDFNDDGFADLLLGAPGDATSQEDAAYLVYGFRDASVSSRGLNFSFGDEGGFALRAAAADEANAGIVGDAGDINGDGFDDLLVSVPEGTPPRVYVVFGQSAEAPPALDLATLDGSNGFRFTAPGIAGSFGTSISAVGDLNGDGFDDLAVGDPSYGPGDLTVPGQAFILFGAPTFPAVVGAADLDGSNGLTVAALPGNGQLGRAVSSAGDFNNDGIDDLLLGQPGTSGRAYVIYGNSAPRAADNVVVMPAVLEDDPSPSGISLPDLLDSVYVDTEPLAGVAVIENVTSPFEGAWQFNNGGPWFPLRRGQTAADATVLTVVNSFRLLPARDFSGGPIRLELRLWDGNWFSGGDNQDIRTAVNALGGFGDRVTLEISVIPVNDQPAMDADDPPAVVAGDGPQLVANWASFDPGGNETTQTPSYRLVTLTNPQLFLALPEVDADGNLRYTPAATGSGISEAQFVVEDSGGTANGGQNTSIPLQVDFTILDPLLFRDGFEN